MGNTTEIEPKAADGERLGELLDALGMSQKDLADEYGCSPPHISRLITGKRPIPMSLARWLADAQSVNLDWLFTGRAPMFAQPGVAKTPPVYATDEASTTELVDELHRRIEAAEQAQGERMLAFTDDEQAFDRWEGEERFRALPYMRDEAAAGAGRVVDDQVEGYVVVHERIAQSAGRLVCVRIAGDSMAPTLPNGSIVAVQIADGDPRDQVGRIVAARTDDGDVTIKRLAAAKHCLVPRAPHNILHPSRLRFALRFVTFWFLLPLDAPARARVHPRNNNPHNPSNPLRTPFNPTSSHPHPSDTKPPLPSHFRHPVSHRQSPLTAAWLYT